MRKFAKFIFFITLLLMAGGVVFLVSWDVPPPEAKVEKVLPDDRFPH